jgi:hypothetical protein
MTRTKTRPSNTSQQAVELKHGAAVALKNGRFSGCDYAVVGVRRITRGRRVGYLKATLAPVGARRPSKAYAVTVTLRRDEVSSRFSAPSTTYTAAQLRQAIDTCEGTREAIEDRKEKRAEAGREAIGDVDRAAMYANPFAEVGGTNIHPGDRVLIGYSNGPRMETVAKVNWRTGKIAIVASYNQRGVRWLPATLVRRVDCPEQALPCEITPQRQAQLDADGWLQVRFGREFIERSFVIATTREAAAKRGVNYECASSTVYRDPKSGLYHRETGSFD